MEEYGIAGALKFCSALSGPELQESVFELKQALWLQPPLVSVAPEP